MVWQIYLVILGKVDNDVYIAYGVHEDYTVAVDELMTEHNPKFVIVSNGSREVIGNKLKELSLMVHTDELTFGGSPMKNVIKIPVHDLLLVTGIIAIIDNKALGYGLQIIYGMYVHRYKHRSILDIVNMLEN